MLQWVGMVERSGPPILLYRPSAIEAQRTASNFFFVFSVDGRFVRFRPSNLPCLLGSVILEALIDQNLVEMILEDTATALPLPTLIPSRLGIPTTVIVPEEIQQK